MNHHPKWDFTSGRPLCTSRAPTATPAAQCPMCFTRGLAQRSRRAASGQWAVDAQAPAVRLGGAAAHGTGGGWGGDGVFLGEF